MPNRTIPRIVLLALASTIAACVGTDYIADPSMLVAPRLEISPSMAALQIGERIDLHAILYDEYSEPDSASAITYTSSNPQIASAGPDGRIDAIGLGQVAITINAAVGDSVIASAIALVSVVSDPATEIALVRVAPASANLSVGDTLRFVATSLNSARGELATDSYEWRSTDEQVLTIDADGVAVARGSGTALVNATTAGIQSPAIEVTVLGLNLRGTFFSRGGYNAAGTAVLAPDDDGLLVLTFLEDFLIDRGPRLEVFLSPIDMVAPGSINVGELKSIQGAQSYDLPADAELSDFGWVIIHCVPFNVSFGLVELQ